MLCHRCSNKATKSVTYWEGPRDEDFGQTFYYCDRHFDQTYRLAKDRVEDLP